MRDLSFRILKVLVTFALGPIVAHAEPPISQSDIFFFANKYKDKVTEIYQGACFLDQKKTKCTLKMLSVSNSKSLSKCQIRANTIYDYEDATRAGDNWIFAVTDILCGYTKTYQVSKTGMVITRTAPKVKKHEYCESFEPQVEKVKYSGSTYAELEDINIDGCKTMRFDGL